MYNIKKAKRNFWILIVGFNMLYFPMLILGIMGMPRRYYDYLPEFQPLNVLSTVGSWVLVTGLILMLINLIKGMRKGEQAPRNPWGGLTLEWKTQSPPPLENFEYPPVITEGPYEFEKHNKE